MNTGVTGLRVASASHQVDRLVAIPSIIVDDQRLRSWTAAETGVLSAIASPSASGLTITASGTLLSGTSYYYCVCASSGINQSTASNTVTGKPTAVEGFKFAWSGIAAATSYTVYRSTAANTFLPSGLLVTQSATAYNDIS